MNPSNLLDYQIPHAETINRILIKQNVALDGSDTGTGKTYCSVSQIREFNVPTLVLAPKIAKSSWLSVGERMGTEFSISNPEFIRRGKTQYGHWRGKQFFWNKDIKFLVFDECHQYSGVGTLNSKLLIAATRQRIKTLLLSATIADSPLKLWAIGYSLRLHNLDNWYGWCLRHGCYRRPQFGNSLAYSGNVQHMQKLSEEIYPEKGSRMKISDLGDSFPSRQIVSELYDCDDIVEKVNSIYSEMEEILKKVNEKSGTGIMSVVNPLTCLLRQRQRLELLMVPLFETLVRESIENGLHVVVFLNFHESMDELGKKLNVTCRIDGRQSVKERDLAIQEFQNDYAPVILVNSAAGGVAISLHDIRGEFPRIGFISIGYSAINFRQVCGRLHRIGSKSPALYRIPLIAKTFQERLHKNLCKKLDRIDILNDADFLGIEE